MFHNTEFNISQDQLWAKYQAFLENQLEIRIIDAKYKTVRDLQNGAAQVLRDTDVRKQFFYEQCLHDYLKQKRNLLPFPSVPNIRSEFWVPGCTFQKVDDFFGGLILIRVLNYEVVLRCWLEFFNDSYGDA